MNRIWKGVSLVALVPLSSCFFWRPSLLWKRVPHGGELLQRPLPTAKQTGGCGISWADTRTRTRTADVANEVEPSTPRSRLAPLVDSELLRFVSQQHPFWRNGLLSRLRGWNETAASGDTRAPVMVEKKQRDQITEIHEAGDVPQLDGITITKSFPAYYKAGNVANSLLALGLKNQTLAFEAGQAVEQHVMAVWARKRVRRFLQKRDSFWSNAAAHKQHSVVIGRNGTSDGEDTKTNDFLEKKPPRDWVADSFQQGPDALTRAQQFQSKPKRSAVRPQDEFRKIVKLLISDFMLTVSDVAIILTHTPRIVLMMPKKDDDSNNNTTATLEGETLYETTTRAYRQVLLRDLKLGTQMARKVLRHTPGLLTLHGSKRAQEILALFGGLGVTISKLGEDINQLPLLLTRSPAEVFRLVTFLASDAVRMDVDKIGYLLKRPDSKSLLDSVAPPIPHLMLRKDQAINSKDTTESSIFLDDVDSSLHTRPKREQQVAEVYRNMSGTAWALRHEIGAQDLGKLVATYPGVLLLDAETQILPTARHLMRLIKSDDLHKVLHLYPFLLGGGTTDFDRVVSYLKSLGVSSDNLPSMFRSFPALLTMDVEKDMQPIVKFLQEIGISDLGRFITHLPPVFGYSVDEELRPKWNFVSSVCGNPSLYLEAFPAFFSFPFERVIKTRYDYLRTVKKIDTSNLPLDWVVHHGDRDFATIVAQDKDRGAAFAKFKEQRREQLRQNMPPRRSTGPKRTPRKKG